MSAIAGVIRLDGNRLDGQLLVNMLDDMKHCGPDARRFVQSDNAAFGQALLATTPEALNEFQPWTDTATGCIVIADSRLDNRQELANSLGLGDREIDKIGDAELIFAAYREWQENCAGKLLGDFTFAIWDPVSKQLFCARDALGIRQLYYHHVEGKIFAFATTAEALLGLLESPVVFDEGRLTDALTDDLEGHDLDSSFFRDIKRLPPAHSLKLLGGLPPALDCYWQPFQRPPLPFPSNETQWLEQLEKLFVEAVHCRMRSHLPLGAMLSGGLDSSSIVAIASVKLAHDGLPNLSTFSAVNRKEPCAETRAIGLMQKSFKLDAVEIDPENSPELMQAIAEQWPRNPEPFEAMNTLVHAQYWHAHQKNIRIMLDGIDADGLLADGDYLHELARRGQWRKVWQESRASVKFWGSEASLGYFLRPLLSEFLVPGPLRRFVRYLRRKSRSTTANRQALISPEFALHSDLESRYQACESDIADLKRTDGLGNTAYSVVASSNSVTGVERYLRQASLYGIEPRHPFLDRRLVEFCAWLPLEMRLREGYPKWALRQVMNKHLPEEITWRRGKEHLGWLFNKALWKRAGRMLLSGNLHPWLEKAVLDSVQTRRKQVLSLPETEPVNENEIEPLLMLSAVNIWLNKPVKADKTRL